MFNKIKTIAREANFHWKDFIIMLCIAAMLMMATSILTPICD